MFRWSKHNNHLNLKLFIFVGILLVLKFEFLKFRIWEMLNFHPCTCNKCYNTLHTWYFLRFILSEINFLIKIFQEYHLSVKKFRSRSGQVVCRPGLGSKLFAMVISSTAVNVLAQLVRKARLTYFVPIIMHACVLGPAFADQFILSVREFILGIFHAFVDVW